MKTKLGFIIIAITSIICVGYLAYGSNQVEETKATPKIQSGGSSADIQMRLTVLPKGD